jgi:hypothetical protein
LPKLGNSNFESQSTNLQQVLPLFSKYKVIVLGDREFCSVDLANWLKEKGVSFCLRLKKNLCIETEYLVWQRLDELGIVPGTSEYFQLDLRRHTICSVDTTTIAPGLTSESDRL